MNDPIRANRGPPDLTAIWIATLLVMPNPFNPRKEFDEAELLRFGLELKEHGIKQPIRVYRSGEKFVLKGGERRLKACRAVGIELIPALVEDEPANEQELILDQLSENENRESLSPLERAEAYQRVMKLNGWSAAELGQRLRVSASEISRSLTIKGNLAPSLRQHVQSNKLPASIAYELCKLRSQQRQMELAEQVLAGMTRAELVYIIQSERKDKGAKSTAKPVRLARQFDPSAGYEPIKQQLTALLAEVQRAERNNLPISFLTELWEKKS